METNQPDAQAKKGQSPPLEKDKFQKISRKQLLGIEKYQER